MALDPAAVAALRGEVAGPVTDDPAALERFSTDASRFVQPAAAAVAPRDRDDLVRLVVWARRFRVPLVGRGAGTSLDGESIPSPGAVVVDFSGWTAVHEVDTTNRLVRLGPGVVNRELHRRLVPQGLFFPPNPGSWSSSTIGGNVATNAAGPRAFKYGSTRSWVRGLEVVLGTGEVLRVGRRTRKASTGPDVVGLLVGSEGTLGLFSEVTLALAPLPERRVGLVVPVPDGLRFGPAVERLLAPPSPPDLAAVEYVDRRTAAALAREPGSRLAGDSPLLLVELECAADDEERHLERLQERFARAGFPGEVSVYPDADALWTLRGRGGEVLEGVRMREDVAVPWSRLDELFAGIEALARRFDVPVFLFGHLGDGNLHPNFVVDPPSEPARALRRELVLLAKRLGGTISAEHGIGLVKAPYLALEHGPEAVALLASIKRQCDPDGILNPGKLYPASATGPAGPAP